MGPGPAINAVYYNQVQAIDDESERQAFVERLKADYLEEVDILHLASELVVDAVVQPEDLREELVRRYTLTAGRRRDWPAKVNPVTPVWMADSTTPHARMTPYAFAGRGHLGAPPQLPRVTRPASPARLGLRRPRTHAAEESTI